MFWKRISVGDRERVLVIRGGRFDRILEPGEYMLAVSPLTRLETVLYRTDGLAFESEWAKYLLRRRPDLVERHFVLIETSDTEVALVSADGRLIQVLPPARRALYWKGEAVISAEIVDVIDSPEVPPAKVPVLERVGSGTLAQVTQVKDGHTGLLYLSNRLSRELEPGKYGFWTAAAPRVEQVDMRRRLLDVQGQEILTRDKVSLRVNIVAEYEVSNAALSARVTRDPAAHLYSLLQLSVRQTLARRTLEEILAERTDVDETVAAQVRSAMAECGVRVGAIALKDIVLPGEIRDILNQVVAAEKQAQANLIRRREETASTRSLLNTVRLMEENPLLIRMKELETLERVVEKVDRVTVSDGFEGLLTNLVSLK
jgi:regulator of protease activity HflC (stomatin/prohibitin superfamily)